MLKLNSTQITNSELPIIVDNYKVLHFDEYPILFTGTNKYGNKLIGSFCDEDDNYNLLYFVIIISDKDFGDFYKKKISYRDLLRKSNELFVLEKTFDDRLLNSYSVPFSEIPVDYIPLEKSYIPQKFVVRESLNYSFSLKGKLADLHKGLVNDINAINTKIYDYLSESLQALSVFGITPKVFSQPSIVGSYRLNFDIDFNQSSQLNFFEIDNIRVTEFVNQYLEYVSQTLPNEKGDFLLGHVEESTNFIAVKEKFNEIFYSSNQEPPKTVSEMLVDSVSSVAEKLSNVSEFMKSNDSFNSIEVGVINGNGQFLSSGIIDSEYKSLVELKVQFPNLLEAVNVVSDEIPKSYRILVYKINSESGKGGARLYPDSSEKYYKITLLVNKNKKDLSNSLFTESLYEDKVVEVSGIATMIDGSYKKLECYL